MCFKDLQGVVVGLHNYSSHHFLQFSVVSDVLSVLLNLLSVCQPNLAELFIAVDRLYEVCMEREYSDLVLEY